MHEKDISIYMVGFNIHVDCTFLLTKNRIHCKLISKYKDEKIMHKILFKSIIYLTVVCVGCAYYNTFYNAKRYYNIAYDGTKKNGFGKPTSQEMQDYQQAIDKALKLIEYYPESNLVDDALLLIGKSYYYREEHFKSKSYLLELMTKYPQSGLIVETKLWLAKTNFALGNYSDAEEGFNDILKDDNSDKFKKETYYYLGKLFEDKEDFQNAVATYENSLHSGLEEFKEETLFAIGVNYDTMGIYDKAAEYFQKVASANPLLEMRYQAQFRYAKVMKKMKRYDEAIALFEKMLGDEKDSNRTFSLSMEIADCLALKGDMEGAIMVYQDFAQNWKKTAYAARAYYALGKMYERDRSNYDRALESYAQVKLELARSEYADSAAVRTRDIQRLQALQQVVEAGLKGEGGEMILMDEEIEEDTLQVGQVYTLMDSISSDQDPKYQLMMDLGGKTFADSVKYESEKRDRMGISQNISVAESYPDQNTIDWCKWFSEGEMPSYTQLLEELPRLKIRIERYEKKITENPELKSFQVEELDKNLFLLGELYLFRFSQPDLAISQYHQIVGQFPESPYASQALYNLSYIFNDVYGDSAKADSCYLQLIELYPSSPFVNLARVHLGLPVVVSREDSIQHMLDLAENAMFNGNDPKTAVKQYAMILEMFPDSKVAPKAAYSMGWIYENQLDSLDRAYAVFENLVNRYPETVYAQKVSKKVEAVKLEKQKEKDEIGLTGQ